MNLPRRIFIERDEDGVYTVPETAKYIGRPVFNRQGEQVLWGSPFRNIHHCANPCRKFRSCGGGQHTPETAQAAYRRDLANNQKLIRMAAHWADKGYDFACRCPEDYPCHGDVIIDAVAIYRWLSRDGKEPTAMELRAALDPEGHAEAVAKQKIKNAKKRGRGKKAA